MPADPASLLPLAVDVLVALTLVYLTARLLFTSDLFAAALLFVALGLTVALAWARLAAPDVALAEAAIGGGLTGALIIRAAMQMRPRQESAGIRLLPAALLALLSAGLAGAALVTLLPLSAPPNLLREAVESGAASLDLEQPVTAVVLVFRAHDTWLELAVLLTAVLAVLGTRPAEALTRLRRRPATDPLLTGVVRLVLPLAVLVGGYLLLQGTGSPGGAFQGGSLSAAALALGYLAGLGVFAALRGWAGRALVLLAFSLPLVLTLPGLLGGEELFGYPESGPAPWLLPLEIAVGLSVTVTLAALFTGTDPPEEDPGEEAD